jgi:hypothetical protein
MPHVATIIRRTLGRWPAILVAAAVALGGAVALVASAPPAAAETIINCDINGDGLQDMPVGAPGEDVNGVRDSGSVFLFTSFPATDTFRGALLPTFRVFGEGVRGDRVGESMSCADFNGDGFDDLVVGAPYADIMLRGGIRRQAGYLQVFYGSPTGLGGATIPPRAFFQSAPGMSGSSSRGDVFAFDLAWCDFDNDGFDDLAVGVPGKDIRGIRDAGAVHIIYGSPSGLGNRDQIIHQGRGRADRPERGDFFGEYVTGDDFNGDGYCDLAVGVPSEDIDGVFDAGAVHIFEGGPRGITNRDRLIHRGQRNVAGRLATGERFGAPISIANIDADSPGFDLVVGVPGHDVGRHIDAGAIQTLLGSPRGLTGRGGQIITQATRGIGGKPRTGNQFGRALAPGDFDGDGRGDIAVGVPGQRVGRAAHAGVVKIIFGNGRRLTNRDLDITGASRRFQRQEFAGIRNPAERGDFFGSSLAIGDFDGDRITDLAIGIPYEDWTRRAVDSGAVQLVRGGAAGLRGANNQILFQEIVDIVLQQPGGDDRCDFFGTFNAGLAIRPPALVTRSNCGGRSLPSTDAIGPAAAPSMAGEAIDGPRSVDELLALLRGG